jgi:hypothetical protein
MSHMKNCDQWNFFAIMWTAPIVCSGGLIKCQTRNRCISVYQVCDGVNDCIDSSDEPVECSQAVVNSSCMS